MLKKIDTTATYITPENAEKVIADLSAGDDDWTYAVNADPSGKSRWVRVEVTDEDGEFVAFL